MLRWVRQSSSVSVTNNPPFPNMPYKPLHWKAGCQNRRTTASAYSAAGGEHDQILQLLQISYQLWVAEPLGLGVRNGHRVPKNGGL